MPGAPRKDVFDPDTVGVYHCYNRCSQRARLCGFDPVTGIDFSHRKAWILDRMKELAGAMAIDILDYALLDNHLHVVQRNRPDLVDRWTDEEVVRRWWHLCPKRREPDGSPAELSEAEFKGLVADGEKVTEYRRRLSDISWFMRLLCQPIGRRANKESDATGRFFAHRFKCQRLVDERALLACSMYVDLNLVRAGMAKDPATSQFTSAFDRIRGQWQRSHRELAQPLEAVSPNDDQDAWLAPLFLDERAAAYPPPAASDKSTVPTCVDLGASRPFPSPRASDKGFLAMELEEYLALLTWTGREVRSEEPQPIPHNLASLFKRLEIAPDHWIDTVKNFGSLFRNVAGGLGAMRKQAAHMGRRWLYGMQHGADAFP